MKLTRLLFATLITWASFSGCGSTESSDHINDQSQKSHASESNYLAMPKTSGVISKHKKFAVVVEWLTPVKASKHLNAKLTFLDANRKPLAKVTHVKFLPWMPSMGHGTAMDDQTITQHASKKNVFLVNKAYLIMGGQWELKVSAKVNGVEDVALVPVRVR